MCTHTAALASRRSGGFTCIAPHTCLQSLGRWPHTPWRRPAPIVPALSLKSKRVPEHHILQCLDSPTLLCKRSQTPPPELSAPNPPRRSEVRPDLLSSASGQRGNLLTVSLSPGSPGLRTQHATRTLLGRCSQRGKHSSGVRAPGGRHGRGRGRGSPGHSRALWCSLVGHLRA